MRFPVRGFVAAATVLWLVVPAATYGQQGPHDRQEEMSMQERPIEKVLNEYTDNLLTIPGVVGTALGECAGTPCIKVFVVERTPELLEKIPPALKDYPVVVNETGKIQALELN